MTAKAESGETRRRTPLQRWIVPALLALLHLAAWGFFLSGGFRAILAWWALQTVVPVVGVCALLPGLAIAAWRRSVGPTLGVTLLLGLLALYPAAWSRGIGLITFPTSIEGTQPAATVRLPSDQALRVAWGGDRVSTNLHAFYPDQRWAYDLLVEPALNGSTRPEDYGCWGTPVLAPIDAAVALAHDGEPDVPPGTLLNELRPFGNFVSLRLETGGELVLAHLQSGSVTVNAGERVREGQPLGLCGNSGHTSEPHIHIHHQRQPLQPDYPGTAEGLPLFFRDHAGPPMPEGGLDEVDGRILARGPILQHRRTP